MYYRKVCQGEGGVSEDRQILQTAQRVCVEDASIFAQGRSPHFSDGLSKEHLLITYYVP